MEEFQPLELLLVSTSSSYLFVVIVSFLYAHVEEVQTVSYCFIHTLSWSIYYFFRSDSELNVWLFNSSVFADLWVCQWFVYVWAGSFSLQRDCRAFTLAFRKVTLSQKLQYFYHIVMWKETRIGELWRFAGHQGRTWLCVLLGWKVHWSNLKTKSFASNFTF